MERLSVKNKVLALDLGSVWERGSSCVPKKFEIFFFAKI
jgi:hypothetical protein